MSWISTKNKPKCLIFKTVSKSKQTLAVEKLEKNKLKHHWIIYSKKNPPQQKSPKSPVEKGIRVQADLASSRLSQNVTVVGGSYRLLNYLNPFLLPAVVLEELIAWAMAILGHVFSLSNRFRLRTLWHCVW